MHRFVASEIVSELRKAQQSKLDVSLNGIRAQVCKRNKVKQMPRLVDIIAAVPEQDKEALLPKLKAKPIRTASGVHYPPLRSTQKDLLSNAVDRRGGSYVKAASMSAYSYDWEHLCVGCFRYTASEYLVIFFGRV